ncbi:hypothetical protein B0T16DRAFT_395775 [Cercophora newfieldiana]|uniref:NADP-dependent oxidoreductase domain-containing protein n=1 Tax=Cercophora newfieldiana TaxID=92897 RepID=A0AA39YLP3_9PEZI|nr:hypothetical protein B0T16DRAFT_395775 [Cercophora newfieldiana]
MTEPVERVGSDTPMRKSNNSLWGTGFSPAGLWVAFSIAAWAALGGGHFKTRAQRENQALEGRATSTLASEAEVKVSEVLEGIAERKGTLLTSVAQAYVQAKVPYVFPIVGGRTVEHLNGNIEALKVKLSREEIREIEAALPFDLGFPSNLYGGRRCRRSRGMLGCWPWAERWIISRSRSRLGGSRVDDRHALLCVARNGSFLGLQDHSVEQLSSPFPWSGFQVDSIPDYMPLRSSNDTTTAVPNNTFLQLTSFKLLPLVTTPPLLPAGVDPGVEGEPSLPVRAEPTSPVPTPETFGLPVS